MPGVVGVMTAKDIKGTNRLKRVVADRPVLSEDKVRYIGDPVAVVAAETGEQAVEAARAVKVENTASGPGFTGEGAGRGAIQLYDDRPNLCFASHRSEAMPRRRSEAAAVIESRLVTQITIRPLQTEACSY